MQQHLALNHKLTDWSNEPTLIDLKRDLEAAKPTHQGQVRKINLWNDLLRTTGQAKPPKVKGRSSVQPKVIRRQAEWRYPALSEPFLSSKHLYDVKPHTFEDANAARQNGLVVNYQFRNMINRVKFIDEYVRSVTDEGTVILQVGWCRVTEPTTETVPVWQYLSITDESQLQQLQQAIELKQSDPRTYSESIPPELQAAVDYFAETQQPNVAVQVGTQQVKSERIIKNHPTVDVLNPLNVIIDPSCKGDISKAMFVVLSFETNHAELLAQGKRYKNLDQIDWAAAGPIMEPDHDTNTPSDFNLSDKARKKVVAYEYWGFWDIDGSGKLEPIVCTWIGNVMIRMEKNPFPDGKLPFILVPYLPVKREVYGEPDAELLEDNQKVIGALMRGMVDLLGRSANAQQGFAKGMLDPLNKRRYENGQDYEFNPNMPPAQGMITHTYPELPQSALMMLNIQNQDAEALSGVKSFADGLNGATFGDVAAGIRGALDASSKREMTILRRLAQGLIELGTKFCAMNAVWLSEEETIRITNETFVKIRREDLKGNFDLEVDISTAEVDNAKAQDLAFMLQTLGNTVDVGLTMEILAEICELKRMPELAHKLRNFQPKPDPLQERAKAAEVAKLEAEVEEIRSRAALNNAKAEQARAEAMSTAAGTEEQVTGVAHARDMEKQEGQAQGNKELAITKALTTPRKPDDKAPDIEAAAGYNELTGNNPRLSSQIIPLPVDNLGERSDLAMAGPGQF